MGFSISGALRHRLAWILFLPMSCVGRLLAGCHQVVEYVKFMALWLSKWPSLLRVWPWLGVWVHGAVLWCYTQLVIASEAEPDTYVYFLNSWKVFCLKICLWLSLMLSTSDTRSDLSRIRLKSGRNPTSYVIIVTVASTLPHTTRAHSGHSPITKAELWFWNKQRQRCGEVWCFSWLTTGVLKCLHAGNDLGTVAGFKHPWKSIPSCPDLAQTTLRRHTQHFPLLCWLVLL